MILGVLKSSLISIGIAFLVQVALGLLGSRYIYDFLFQHMINIQLALLAVNAATLGIVLTKLRDLVDKGVDPTAFKGTKNEMLLSIREQIALIVVVFVVLSLQSAKNFSLMVPGEVFDTLLLACFAYELIILYDTANSVFVLLDD